MLDLIRYAAFALFAVCSGAAVASWAIRTRRLPPFGAATQTLRRLSDPLVDPVERWVVRRGGNPHNAPWWLFGFGLVGGILLVTVSQWLATQLARLSLAQASGPRGMLRLVVNYAGQLVLIAILVRVIGSWFGAGRYNRWMRWTYVLTDWCIEPLRKIIPPIGMIDITPIVAWFLLQIALGWVLALI